MADAALIEDFFAVNDQQINLPPAVEVDLFTPFCLAGPGVFKFELSANIALDVNFAMALMINDDTVAMS